MRIPLITLILFVFFCGKDNQKYSNTNGKDSVHPDSIRTVVKSQEENQPIKFLNGETLSVTTNFYTDKVIDSILIKKKSFEAVYKNCGKGILNLNLFYILKRKNSLEYKLLEEMTTAHAININEQHYYFNGRNSIDSIPECGTLILLNATIYSMFSNGNHVCNILVLDTIHSVIEPKK